MSEVEGCTLWLSALTWMKIAALILICILTGPSLAQEITVASAADLHAALDEISAHYKAAPSTPVKIVYGSSGNLYQQIQNGAPFDLFLSANSDYPKKLEAAGLIVAGSYYEYARGHIVLFVASTSTLNLEQGLQVLLDASIKRIAIADPAHAPYGQAAIAVLKSQGLYDRVSRKIVVGENVAQAASFVTSGAADVGIIAMSLALLPSARAQTRFAEIPANEYPPIVQACVILKSSKAQTAAARFLSYIRGPEASKVLQRYGFEVPATQDKPPLQ
jgi:molybdate transport system substrate-binding protein